MIRLLKYPEDRDAILKICSMIDYTEALNPNCTAKDVIKACETVRRFGFSAMVCYPTWISLAVRHMIGSGIPVQAPIGFPHGATTTVAKTAEARQALIDGAREIDMVVNVARFLDGDEDYVRQDIQSVVAVAQEYDVKVKAIIEIGYLNDEQKRRIVEIAIAGGAAFVKTSTGFGPGRATMHDIALLVEAAAGRCQIKATGSVASLEDQLAFIELGATRVAGRGHIVEQLTKLGYEGIG